MLSIESSTSFCYLPKNTFLAFFWWFSIFIDRTDARFEENTFLKANKNFSLENVQLTLANGTISFFVGSVHHDWCTEAEKEQIDLFSSTLSGRRNDCTVVDVGMNDGFYSNLAAAFGCKVYSFEIQPRCIHIARTAVARNGFGLLVNIFHLPVSNQNGNEMDIVISKGVCNGEFTLQGHSASPNEGRERIPSVSLNGFIHKNITVDIIKIDTEGHETEVLQGAMDLFREHRVRMAVMEIHPQTYYTNFSHLLLTFRSMLSFNYSVTPLNCNHHAQMKHHIWTHENVTECVQYLSSLDGIKDSCPDVHIQLLI